MADIGLSIYALHKVILCPLHTEIVQTFTILDMLENQVLSQQVAGGNTVALILSYFSLR